jgi:gas vesicle protein
MSSSHRTPPSPIGTFLFDSLLGLGIGGLLALLLTPTSGQGIRTWFQQKMAECPCWQTETTTQPSPQSTKQQQQSDAERFSSDDDPYENEVGY